MKKIGFLSFGHWTPSPHSQTRSAADALLQSIELAVAAEELGADGAYFRVHHFARQLGSPLDPVLYIGNAQGAAIGSNDDSGGPDSYFRFTAPADGDYGFPSLTHLANRYAEAAERRAKLEEIANFRLPHPPRLEPLPTVLPRR